eukprot:gene11240-11389_t
MPPEAAAWLNSIARSRGAAVSGSNLRGPLAAYMVKPGADSAAAGLAAAAARFRRWGITEGPIRRTPYALAGPGSAMSCQCVASAGAASLQLPAHSMWETAKYISAREGLPVLWRGTWASLLIAVPMVGIYMPLYDALLAEWSSKLGSVAPVAAGTAARTAACFCVAPFELLRTRLQAAAGTGLEILIANMFSGFVAGGLAAGLTTPFDVEGFEGLFTGVKPRAYRAAPACAIVISVYELLKDMLASADVSWPVTQQAAHAG